MSLPQYQTILHGRDEHQSRESYIDTKYISIPPVGEEMKLDGNLQDSDSKDTDDYLTPPREVGEEMKVDGNLQDSDSEDTDNYLTPPSSLHHVILDPEAVNEEVAAINFTETEVNHVEERHKVEDKIDDDETVVLSKCEEEIIPKTGRTT